ncbi:MAG: hypothetical protein L0Y42_08355 [Phycisphaerales bacterium]|nr:hypothetical protein [Phycisphaerales bacterium]
MGTDVDEWRKADCALIVISHDCDVLNQSITVEPQVELLKAIRSESQDGNIRFGKNPRRYEFDVVVGGNAVPHTINVNDRYSVPRDWLSHCGPDGTRKIDSQTVRSLAAWLARRYTRAAFPTAFNERTRSRAKEIRNTLKNGVYMEGIYLLVDNRELSDSDHYNIEIRATMQREFFEDNAKRVKSQRVLDDVESLLASCEGVHVEKAELLSEKEFSLDDLRNFKRWDFDDLTVRAQVETRKARTSG